MQAADCMSSTQKKKKEQSFFNCIEWDVPIAHAPEQLHTSSLLRCQPCLVTDRLQGSMEGDPLAQNQSQTPQLYSPESFYENFHNSCCCQDTMKHGDGKLVIHYESLSGTFHAEATACG